eukprot:6492163-Amphidinium_carterae.4
MDQCPVANVEPCGRCPRCLGSIPAMLTCLTLGGVDPPLLCNMQELVQCERGIMSPETLRSLPSHQMIPFAWKWGHQIFPVFHGCLTSKSRAKTCLCCQWWERQNNAFVINIPPSGLKLAASSGGAFASALMQGLDRLGSACFESESGRVIQTEDVNNLTHWQGKSNTAPCYGNISKPRAKAQV